MEEFYDLFISNQAVSDAQRTRLQEFVNAYPYCQPAWMLLAKTAQQSGDTHYREILSTTAARVFDREVLYDYIYLTSLTEVAPPEKAAPAEEKPQTSVKKEVPRTNISPEEKAAKATAPKVESATEVVPPKPIQDEKGKEIKSKEELQKKVKERLEAIEKEHHKAEKEVKPELQTKQEEVTKPLPKKQKFEIIEQFIKQSPGISKPKDDAYENELEIAERSLNEEFDFVSETLATIYERQGHHVKAIKIYKQLMLKYPEKSSYFAAQIQKLKTKD